MDIRLCRGGTGLFLETHQQLFWQVLLQVLSSGPSPVVVSLPKVVNLVSWVICSQKLQLAAVGSCLDSTRWELIPCQLLCK